jgi:hypothetical protein
MGAEAATAPKPASDSMNSLSASSSCNDERPHVNEIIDIVNGFAKL